MSNRFVPLVAAVLLVQGCAVEGGSAESTDQDLTGLPKPKVDPDDPWGYGGSLIDPWKSDHPTYAFTDPPGDVEGLPGEFEATDELLVAVGAPTTGGFDPAWKPFFVELLKGAASTGVPITMIDTQLNLHGATEIATDLLNSAHLDASAVQRVGDIPAESVWMRDYGPLVVRTTNGGRRIIDGRYLLEDDHGPRYNDDAVPTHLSQSHWKSKGWPVSRPPIMLEGGFVQADGSGACLTTTGLLSYNGWVFPYSQADVQLIFAKYLGCRQTTFLTALKDEGTGHLDIFATITAAKHVLLGSYETSQDADNARILDENAAILQRAGFQVTRIPMPDIVKHGGAKTFRTYTNSLALAGPKGNAVLVPVYKSDRKHQAAALAAFTAAYPDRHIVPIDASTIIEYSGAIHCTTMSVAK